MERESTDDDNDREGLVAQTGVNFHPILNFNIDSHMETRRRVTGSNFSFGSFGKRYYCCLFCVCVTLFVAIIVYSVDLRNIFSVGNVGIVSSSDLDGVGDRMREAELRALYLLKEQELGLFSVLNSGALINRLYHLTNLSVTNLTSSAFLNAEGLSAAFDGFKYAVEKQILLNREVQQVLLSPHRLGSLLDFSDIIENGSFRDISQKCGRVDQKLSSRRTIEWKPRSDKYLFAVCVSGQMSNHLICLEKHMVFAALLNRVLVIPSSKVDYDYHRVLDIEHVNECLGRKVVVTFREFSEAKRNHLHINRFICYFSLPELCYMDKEHLRKIKSLGISVGKMEFAWVEDIKNPVKRTVPDVKAKFASDDDVIAIGDMFYADMEQEWVMQPGGPLAHKCKTLIEPSKLIRLTAQRFIQTFLGKDFVALHFRRHGFLKFCNAKEPSCFYPVPQAAECINRVVQRANTPVIYLSTDAAESETGLLQALLVVNGKAVPLVKRPPRNSAEKWDALLYRHGLEDDRQVEAMLDKTICAMSTVFIGASGSTFTEDILRLRKDWGTTSDCDQYLCQGELPNFIAENV
ncbi:unnamed protein product [Rhodiola kirilowii]